MKYDDASWHYGGEFPADLPNEAGGTHTGMFLAWALLSGLAGSVHQQGCPNNIQVLRSRSLTPGQFFLKYCDGKFTDEDLSEVGNKFVADYFDFKLGTFLSDYDEVLATNLPTLYHVEDKWENFEKLSSVLDRRFTLWRHATSRKG